MSPWLGQISYRYLSTALSDAGRHGVRTRVDVTPMEGVGGGSTVESCGRPSVFDEH